MNSLVQPLVSFLLQNLFWDFNTVLILTSKLKSKQYFEIFTSLKEHEIEIIIILSICAIKFMPISRANKNLVKITLVTYYCSNTIIILLQ